MLVLASSISPLTVLAWPVVGVLTVTTAALAFVQARASDGGLALEVIDSGVGLQAAAQGHTGGSGLGLSSLRERLSLVYGPAARLDVTANALGGVSALVWVPHQQP